MQSAWLVLVALTPFNGTYYPCLTAILFIYFAELYLDKLDAVFSLLS